MEQFERYFSNNYPEEYALDAGDWKMEIRNDSDELFHFKGSLCDGGLRGEEDLSDLVRNEINMPNLYVFDGNID